MTGEDQDRIRVDKYFDVSLIFCDSLHNGVNRIFWVVLRGPQAGLFNVIKIKLCLVYLGPRLRCVDII